MEDLFAPITNETQPSSNEVSPSVTPQVDIDPIIEGVIETVSGNQPVEQSQPSPKKEENLTEAEKAYRALQSKYDKTVAELQKLKQVENFLTQFDTDDEFRASIVARYYPDLFKPKSSIESIRETLTKEFGEDWEQKLENGSTLEKFEIQERIRELREQAKKQYNIKPFEELILQRKKQIEEQQKQALQEIEEAKELGRRLFNADDNEFQEYINWAKKLKPKDLYYMYLRAKQSKTQSTAQAPTVGSLGGNNIASVDKELKRLEDLFGRPPQGLI